MVLEARLVVDKYRNHGTCVRYVVREREREREREIEREREREIKRERELRDKWLCSEV